MSNHSRLKLEMSNRRKIRKFTSICHYTSWTNQWVKQEITREIKRYLVKNEKKNSHRIGEFMRCHYDLNAFSPQHSYANPQVDEIRRWNLCY